MKILAIETSTEACSAALLSDGEVREQYEIAPRGHGDLILNMVDSLLADAQYKPQQLDAIAFGRGPGAFTGVRIATSVTQGIALGADLPVVPISTLEVVAQGANRLHGCTDIVCAMDARMDEVYFAAYKVNGKELVCLSDEVVCKPKDIPHISKSIAWSGVGTGWRAYEGALNERFADNVICKDAEALPHAIDLLSLAEVYFSQGRAVCAEEAIPVYLRDNVVS